MRTIAFAALIWLAGCSHASATPPYSSPASDSDAEARAFALRVIDVLERDDVAGWRDLLSARVRRRTDDAELRRLFDAWRRYLVPHADALRAADWTAKGDVIRYRTVGSRPTRLARVVEEHGALRIDEH
jgi:hypothetical protein